MAYSKVSRQTYFGRVTSPATKKEVNGKPALEFSLAIDKAVTFKNAQGGYEKKSLFMRCTYFPSTYNGKDPELDPVVAILTRISSKDVPNNLAGVQYNSVEALVEGVEEFYENNEGRMFKNLKSCTVQITDNNLLQSFFNFRDAQTGGNNGGGQSYNGNSGGGQQTAPQQQFAPQQTAPQAPQAPQQVAAPQQAQPQIAVGTIQNIGGVPHQLIGNDPSVRENWVPGTIQNGQFIAASSQQSLVANTVVNGTTPQQAAPQQPAPVVPQAPQSAPGVTSVKSAFLGGNGNGEASFVQAPPAVPGATS